MIENERAVVNVELASLANSNDVPAVVEYCSRRLSEIGAWCQFSRNEPATSCQDAARKRNRLGHKGIPLCDELKSFLGEYDSSDDTRLFLAHCRGDRELDLEKVKVVLRATAAVRRLSPEAAARLGAAYGVVNPFVVNPNVVQIFDQELRVAIGVPGTMMTNAGDHTWAVEFFASEVVERMPSASWEDISLEAVEGTDRARVLVQDNSPIGIITGNPSDSGLELCGAINTHIREFMGRDSLGDVSMPKIIMISRPQIGISMEMSQRERPLRAALLEAVDEICATGARIIAHPAHTTHYFGDEIAERASRYRAVFVSMAQATDGYVQRLGIRELALLGTQFVTDAASRWSVYNNAFQGVQVHRPSTLGWKKIHDLGYEVQQRGLTPLAFNWMRDLLRDEVPKNCEHVVLAMTEFAPVARQLRNRGRHGKNLIEPLDLYGEAIAREYMQRLSA
jgi:aspartate/glutamate racemase/prolyl-tRNA editing enzyme YbaK/EbsC (Cys-tRNA(Pro) deacylase)